MGKVMDAPQPATPGFPQAPPSNMILIRYVGGVMLLLLLLELCGCFCGCWCCHILVCLAVDCDDDFSTPGTKVVAPDAGRLRLEVVSSPEVAVIFVVVVVGGR